MNWPDDRQSVSERISGVLRAMGYKAPVIGQTDDRDAMLMICTALEDLRDRLLNDQIRSALLPDPPAEPEHPLYAFPGPIIQKIDRAEMERMYPPLVVGEAPSK